MTNRGFDVPNEEAYAAIEAPNGELGFYLVGDGSDVAYRARCRPPSFIHFALFPELDPRAHAERRRGGAGKLEHYRGRTGSVTSRSTTMPPKRVLTDEMIAAIKAFFPRYPTRQAVTLPALHIVNEQAALRAAGRRSSKSPSCSSLRPAAGARHADVLRLSSSKTQPHGQTAGLGLPLDQLRAARRRRAARSLVPHGSASQPGETTPDGRVTLEYRRMPGRLRASPPACWPTDSSYKNVTPTRQAGSSL